MNKTAFIIILAFIACVGGITASSHKYQHCSHYSYIRVSKDSTELSRAYVKVAQLPDFQKLPNSLLKSDYPKGLGKAQGVVYGNADPRDTVLGILDEIPSELLYREFRDETEYIVRYYIEGTSNGKAKMLIAYLGHGGNDLVVILFDGANKKKYQKVVDSIDDDY